jgi:hypothetical protein
MRRTGAAVRRSRSVGVGILRDGDVRFGIRLRRAPDRIYIDRMIQSAAAPIVVESNGP